MGECPGGRPSVRCYLCQRKLSNPAGILIQQRVPLVDEGSQAFGAQDPRDAH
jgi:hypothetical protein